MALLLFTVFGGFFKGFSGYVLGGFVDVVAVAVATAFQPVYYDKHYYHL